ncbi:hypothetical protein ALQ67_05258 [Pseudomonas savastanoi pv. glycinea]|nr:hypothetical protein ALQ69_05495 [Pseudomonas savastanoi pv. glycinea]RMN08203.1 hypothetical protein ALQ67_05258 [Pseudomonas savastanoi pv. glycinea]RMN21043.1 hypothetical protein ALQ66_05591 [Pseudomonas savastanoi pv. glycinea]
MVLLAGGAGNAVLPAFADQGLLPGGLLGSVFGLTLKQRLIGNIVAPYIAHTGPQVGVEGAEQLTGTAHRPLKIGHAPANAVGRRLSDRAIELGGRGQQHLQRLLVIQVRKTLHHQCQRPGGVRCRHRGAGLDPVTAAGHGAVDQTPGRGDAPVFGQAALVVALTVAAVEARYSQPVAFEVWLEIRQRRPHAGIGVTAVACTEHVYHALARDIRRFVQPGSTVVVLSVGSTHTCLGGVGHVGWLAAPAVVDGAYSGICQRPIHRLEILRGRARAEQEAVVLIGVADVDLCVVRHAMHADAIARRAHGAGDVRAVGIVVRVDGASDAEGRTVNVSTGSGDCVIAGRSGFRVGRVKTRVQRTDLDACASDASGVGLISLNTPQAPVALEFCRTPTGSVTRFALLDIIRVGRAAKRKRQRTKSTACYWFKRITDSTQTLGLSHPCTPDNGRLFIERFQNIVCSYALGNRFISILIQVSGHKDNASLDI